MFISERDQFILTLEDAPYCNADRIRFRNNSTTFLIHISPTALKREKIELELDVPLAYLWVRASNCVVKGFTSTLVWIGEKRLLFESMEDDALQVLKRLVIVDTNEKEDPFTESDLKSLKKKLKYKGATVVYEKLSSTKK